MKSLSVVRSFASASFRNAFSIAASLSFHFSIEFFSLRIREDVLLVGDNRRERYIEKVVAKGKTRKASVAKERVNGVNKIGGCDDVARRRSRRVRGRKPYTV